MFAIVLYAAIWVEWGIGNNVVLLRPWLALAILIKLVLLLWIVVSELFRDRCSAR